MLTASGGPFRGRADLGGVTPTEALAHPTWEMGGRITIDSATLLNKGFELIEAHHLFGFPYERIDVVGPPPVDRPRAGPSERRRHAGPSRLPGHAGADLLRAPLSGAGRRRPADPRPGRGRRARPSSGPTSTPFPCLRLAREAGEAGGTAPCVLNAADEVAVEAFLDGRIPFTAIAEVVERTLDALPAADAGAFRGPVRRRRRGARPGPRADRAGGRHEMSWVLTIAGFAALIILHELGHFTAAKATGMRVERFFLFFPPKVGRGPARRDGVRNRRPAVRGLREDHRHEPRREAAPGGRAPRLLPPAGLEADRRDRRRAGDEPAGRFRAAVRARLRRRDSSTTPVGRRSSPARRPRSTFKPGDRILAVDGKSFPNASTEERLARFARLVGDHKCPGKQTDGCRAKTPVHLRIERDGQVRTLAITPGYDAGVGRTRLGFSYGSDARDPVRAAGRRRRGERDVAGHDRHGRGVRPDLPGPGAQEDPRDRRDLRRDAPGDSSSARARR